MFALVTGGEGFSPQAVFNAPQTSSTGGSATFAGSSSARTFEAYVGDDTTLASLETVDGARIDTGGLFTLGGALNGNSQLISSDIDIGANASVNNGYLLLISRNSSQTLIGDGLDALGQGYRLSDAEADRIHTAFSVVPIRIRRGRQDDPGRPYITVPAAAKMNTAITSRRSTAIPMMLRSARSRSSAMSSSAVWARR